MFGRQELERLRLLKQALIMESQLNRLSLQADWQDLRHAGARLTSPASVWQKATPWLPVLASVAGFFAIRRLRGPGSLLGRIISFLKWVQPAYALWTGFRTRATHRQ